jgi:hypothetical protein
MAIMHQGVCFAPLMNAAANFSAAGADAAATEYEIQHLNIGVQFFRNN